MIEVEKSYMRVSFLYLLHFSNYLPRRLRLLLRHLNLSASSLLVWARPTSPVSKLFVVLQYVFLLSFLLYAFPWWTFGGVKYSCTTRANRIAQKCNLIMLFLPTYSYSDDGAGQWQRVVVCWRQDRHQRRRAIRRVSVHLLLFVVFRVVCVYFAEKIHFSTKIRVDIDCFFCCLAQAHQPRVRCVGSEGAGWGKKLVDVICLNYFYVFHHAYALLFLYLRSPTRCWPTWSSTTSSPTRRLNCAEKRVGLDMKWRKISVRSSER